MQIPEDITRENFSKAMEQAVAERGSDWVYPQSMKVCLSADDDGTCQYTNEEGAPMCLIGYALYLLGHVIPSYIYRGAFSVMYGIGVTDDPALLNAAVTAQRLQDDGKTWGEALQGYYERLNAS